MNSPIFLYADSDSTIEEKFRIENYELVPIVKGTLYGAIKSGIMTVQSRERKGRLTLLDGKLIIKLRRGHVGDGVTDLLMGDVFMDEEVL